MLIPKRFRLTRECLGDNTIRKISINEISSQRMTTVETEMADANNYIVSKCLPRFGSARRFSASLRSFRPGRTTITGTGECARQYLQINTDVRATW